jgi:hypothetical protein
VTAGRKLLVALFVLMLPFVSVKVRGADEIEYFSHLRSMVFDRDLDFANEYAFFYAQDPQALQGFKGTFLDKREPATGRHINFTPVGAAMLWSPFYLLAHAAVLATGGVADGFSKPYVAATSYASAFYGFLGLLLTHDALRRWAGISDLQAAATTATMWWGTPLLYYMTIAPGFSHSTATFTVALVTWLSLRTATRGTWTVAEAARLGLAGGLAALVYEKELLYLVVPGLLLTTWMLRTRRFVDGLRAGVAMGVVALAVFVPQLAAYKVLNGTYGPSEYVRRKMIWWSPHFFEVLVDPGHGMFFWTPLLLIAVAGLVFVAVRRASLRMTALLVAFVLQIYICGCVDSWHLAGAFGARRFVSATPILAFGLAPLVTWLWERGGRMVAGLVLSAFVWWNVSLMVQFGLRLMNRQELEWPRVAQNQVIEVPRRLGRALWLYLVDRQRLLEETR